MPKKTETKVSEQTKEVVEETEPDDAVVCDAEPTTGYWTWAPYESLGLARGQVEALTAPLDPALTERRSQGGREFTYLKAHSAIDQANRIFGFVGWDGKVQSVNIHNVAGRTVVTATYEVEVLGATRTDVGVGIAAGDSPEAFETALKGAVSDAMKRTLRTFGNQFGNALYGERPAPTVQTVPAAPKAQPATADGEVPACADCGAAITGWTTADGTEYSAASLAASRTRRYGRPLCGRCAGRAKAAA